MNRIALLGVPQRFSRCPRRFLDRPLASAISGLLFHYKNEGYERITVSGQSASRFLFYRGTKVCMSSADTDPTYRIVSLVGFSHNARCVDRYTEGAVGLEAVGR